MSLYLVSRACKTVLYSMICDILYVTMAHPWRVSTIAIVQLHVPVQWAYEESRRILLASFPDAVTFLSA